jgi:hypothetical protein
MYQAVFITVFLVIKDAISDSEYVEFSYLMIVNNGLERMRKEEIRTSLYVLIWQQAGMTDEDLKKNSD